MALSLRLLAVTAALIIAPCRGVRSQDDTTSRAGGDSVSVRFANVDLRAAIQALGRYLDRPVVFGNIGEVRVTLEAPRPVPRAQLPDLLRGLLRTYGMAL